MTTPPTGRGSRATYIRKVVLYADGNTFHVQSLHLSYEDGAVRTEANSTLVCSAREEVYGALIDAFEAAGWSHSSRLYTPTLGAKDGFREGDRLFVTFHHPSTLTLTGHPHYPDDEMEPRP